jgi:hypothetical protein
MNASNEHVTASSASLMPHQQAFVASVFATGAKRVHLLSAAPGFGKSTALIAAGQRLLAENPRARLLILVPAAALASYFAERLRTLAVPVVIVDRYRFRELKNAVAATHVARRVSGDSELGFCEAVRYLCKPGCRLLGHGPWSDPGHH